MTKDEHINDILKKLRQNIKPSTGPLTSIDPKKLARASKDVKIAKEIAEIVKKNNNNKKSDKDEDKE